MSTFRLVSAVSKKTSKSSVTTMPTTAARLSEVVERLADRPQAAFRRATAMFGVRREQAKLDWIADVRPLLLAAAACASGRGAEEC